MSGKPPNPFSLVVFFLDRTHGRATERILTAVGMSVVPHTRYFPKEEKDPIWIAKCGQQNWIILSGDKEIERVPENRQAVINAKCKVIFFNDSNSQGEEWAAAILVGRERILEIIQKYDGPLFVTVKKYARSHISPVRCVAGGGLKPIQPEAVITPEQKPLQPPPNRKPQQHEFEFEIRQPVIHSHSANRPE